MMRYAPLTMIREFFRLEATAGIFLGLSAVSAIVIKNTPISNYYDCILNTPILIQAGNFAINKPFLLWVNDGFMAIFFLLVGLEIKREMIEGQLSSKEQVVLPAIGAFGGLIGPALIYVFLNWNDSHALNGWAIPAATDIAFALGVITLLGKRVPESLKICLVAIAIIDDLAAIIIIALFYTSSLAYTPLAYAILSTIVLYIMNKRGITKITPYIIVGSILWVCVLKSGIHATLAGIVIALSIPLRAKNTAGQSPAISLEHKLHPWVAYLILPIFAFANAGVSIKGFSLDMLFHPITVGIALGLFFGKQIGIMAMAAIGVATKKCTLPKGVNWGQFYAMSLITGIGFTMSLFIGNLAFESSNTQVFVRFGVIFGSLLSGILGYALLKKTCPNKG